jgi:hypothetical protein
VPKLRDTLSDNSKTSLKQKGIVFMNKMLKAGAVLWLFGVGILAPLMASAADAPGTPAPAAPAASTAPAITGEEVVRRCDFKNPGKDQESTLTITLLDQENNEKKNVYHRYWKDYAGAEGVADKMVLFTEFPPDAKGAAFMRWAYTSADKNADQWIYLPVLKKIRRVSIRDPGDSFLGSDLSYWDIGFHAVEDDEHTLVKTQEKGDQTYYLVESRGRGQSDPLYSKRLSVYIKNKSWDQCSKARLEYYDKKGLGLKVQLYTWQQVNGAWVWNEVKVQNIQTKHTSLFKVTDVKVNVGLKDDVFSERRLTVGNQ